MTIPWTLSFGDTSMIAGSSQKRFLERTTLSVNREARSQLACLKVNPFKSRYLRANIGVLAIHVLSTSSSRRKVGILSIQGDQFDIEPVVLKTVRPFKMGEIVMEEEADDPANDLDLQLRDSVTAFLEKKVCKNRVCPGLFLRERR